MRVARDGRRGSRIRRALVLALPALLAGAGAALSFAGQPPASRGRPEAIALDRVAAWSAPLLDVAGLLREDAARALRRDLAIPLRVGFRFETDLAPAGAGTWEDLGEGDRLWRLRLRSAGALWLVAGFDSFRLQDGGALWIYAARGATVLGPFTASDVRDHGELWTPPIEGDEIVLELYWPAARRGEMPRLHLGTVSHGYRPFGTIGRAAWLDRAGKAVDGIGDSGSCNIDVNCPLGADWQDEKRGVVILLTAYGTSFCTGSMINDTAGDCKPYVLTASHCRADTSTTYGFNFERSDCGSGDPGAPTTYMISGGVVRGNYGTSDFTLLEMSALPPESFGFYLNGWSRDPNPAPQSWVIHHPSGDVKKISHDDDPLVEGVNWGTSHWRVENYEEGTTEGGSSGSPLFDPAGRIVGQLHGGTASCDSITWDEYGKVAASWMGGGTPETRLSDWLDPLATGAVTWDGMDGAECYYQAAGSVTTNRSRYACDDKVAIELRDDDLRGIPTQAVTLASGTEPVPETAVLVAEGESPGILEGAAYVTSAPPVAGDGRLSVAHGDTITVTYVDADDGQGGTNVPRTATAVADCLPPAISDVAASDVTGSTARIAWTTDEPSDGTVTYGVSTPPGSTAFEAALVTEHAVDLSGLAECSVHRFSVRSADAAGNASTDDAGGAYHAFSTGRIEGRTISSAGDPIPIPDKSTIGATSTIAVTDTRTVADLEVLVNVTHTSDGDLSLSLIAPDGKVVSLAERRGGSGDNFRDTVFDDRAAISIADGVAPFTGSYRPETPLAAVAGIQAGGSWRFRVVDKAIGNTGTLDDWTLMLRFTAETCEPHARYLGHSLVADSCVLGGPGSGDGVWDAGETVDFSVTIENDGTTALTGVTATLVPTTAGVAMLQATASYPDLAPGAASVSNAPHFRAALPETLSCGAAIGFEVQLSANEGAWTSSFGQGIGAIPAAEGTALHEDFSGGIPAGWTIVDSGSGGGTAATWTAANPGGRTATAPLAGPFAIVDSDWAGIDATQDEELITPPLDLTGAAAATLEFDQRFYWYAEGGDEKGDVDVRSSLTGGAWVNVLRNQGESSADPDHRTIDITALSAGAPDAQVRFRYYDGSFDWYWQVDNIDVSWSAPGACATSACPAGAVPPPPVPDGTLGAPVRASRAAADGSAIALTWDASTCPAAGYHVLYGSLSTVSSYAIGGSACGIGTSGSFEWTGVPAGDLWFVVVSDDGATVEGSWGQDSAGEERGSSTPSGECSLAFRTNEGTCP